VALSEATTREILAVVDQYVRYYNQKNGGKVLAHFSKDISGFGTGKDEIVMNSAQLKERLLADFCPANAIRLKVKILATGGRMPAA